MGSGCHYNLNFFYTLGFHRKTNNPSGAINKWTFSWITKYIYIFLIDSFRNF